MIKHREIFSVAWPYSLSMATGFIIQGVDSAMVAPMGSAALAALSVAGVTSFIPNSFTLGLVTIVQKRTAVSNDSAVRNVALTNGLVLACLMALPFSLAFYFFATSIAAQFTTGESVGLAADFLKIFCASFVFASMNQALNGFWIGILKSKTRLSITLVTAAVNVVGNLLLIPRLGFTGVAISSLFAILAGFGLNLYFTWKLEGFRPARPDWAQMRADLSTVAGVSLHQISLSLTLNAVVFVVGMLGVEALAVANVIGVLALPALYLGLGYGIATGTFLTRSLAKSELADSRSTAHRALIQVAAVSGGLAIVIWILGPSIRDHFFVDGITREMARIPLLLLPLLYLIDGLCCALQRFHFVSDGLRKSFLIMSGVQWLLFIPAAYLAVKYLSISYTQFLLLHLAHRALIAAILYAAWMQRTRCSRTTANGMGIGCKF